VAQPASPTGIVPPPGYRIVGTLGQGGFGIVLAAERAGDERRVAIKVSRAGQPEAAERLLNEADALRAVGAPFVPRLYEAGTLADGSVYVAMELLEEPTLAKRMAETTQPIAIEELAAEADAILAAVEAAHAKGFAHRDLKPANIFIDSRGQAKLIDFGLAKRLGAEVPGLTVAGTILGTVDYMSPEQCMARPVVDMRSDIYSLGVILYERLVGHTPFSGSSAQIQLAHQDLRPPRPTECRALGRDIEDVILRCLAKSPADRFGSVSELRAALRDACNKGHEPAATIATSTPAVPVSREEVQAVLLFFDSHADPLSVKQALSAFGGELVHLAGTHHVALFSHTLDDKPAQRGFLAGRDLIARAIASTILLDVAPVTVRIQPSGARRYRCAKFADNELFPVASDPAGVLLTQEAAVLLSGLQLQPLRPGVLRCSEARESVPHTGVTPAAPMIGRDEMLARLSASARSALRDRVPTLVTVIGEPGHGKSRFAQALLTELRQIAGARVLDLRPTDAFGADREQALRALLTCALDLPATVSDEGRSALADRLGDAEAADVWAGVALVMGWVASDQPELARRAAAPRMLRMAATRAAVVGLRRLAERHPVALVLDDAHAADDATLDALEAVTAEGMATPIWICALARPSLTRLRAGWGDRAARRESLQLGPLDRDDAARLCRALLEPAQDVPAAAVEQLVSRTQGIPLLLVELVRGLKRDGLIRKHAKGEGQYVATDALDRLPDTPLIGWLARRELEALPPALTAHANLIALLGAEVDAREISGVLNVLEQQGWGRQFPLDAAVATARLVDSGLLIQHRGGRLTFRQGVIREAIEQAMPESIRNPIHAAALSFYRQPSDIPEPVRLRKLALFAERCQHLDEAAATYLLIADQARARHDYLEAEQLYSSALRCLLGDAAPP
jgi:serine/threonine protein kinase